jgi:biotin synthase
MLQDKAMMGRWGLEGMQSFEQASVARKEAALRPQNPRTVSELQAELS